MSLGNKRYEKLTKAGVYPTTLLFFAFNKPALGNTVQIRAPQPTDAEDLLALHKKLDNETTHMLFTAGERSTSVVDQQQILFDAASNPDICILVAENHDQLVGLIAASRKGLQRVSHNFNLVIGVRKDYWGKGVSDQLYQALICRIMPLGAKRLELTVMASNTRAIAFYTRIGFVKEGIRRHSMMVEGRYIDEIYMANWLGKQQP